jgi:hypothetical protein
MRALLDVNVIIALFDPDHAFHKRAHEWWAQNVQQGWASCPITENGVVRIMSNPGYSQKARFTAGDLISRLKVFVRNTDHQFWPDDLTLLDDKLFAADRCHSSRQITDLYLVALAAKNQGTLATFDQGIPLSAVKTANASNVSVI